MEVRIEEERGNAPKKQVVGDLLSSLANGDWDTVRGYLTPNVVWDMVGGDRRYGQQELDALLERLTDGSALSFVVTDILSHGDRCAASGSYLLTGGNETAFAHFFRFNGHGKNAKINHVRSFVMTIASK